MITGTVVWLMIVVSGYNMTFTTGPEFKTQEACVRAALIIEKDAKNLTKFGFTNSKIQCVKIEK